MAVQYHYVSTFFLIDTNIIINDIIYICKDISQLNL